MKTLAYYLDVNYPFTVRPDTGDDGYIVEFPDLRYCVGTGDSIEKAIKDAMFAKEEQIKTSFEDGVTIRTLVVVRNIVAVFR